MRFNRITVRGLSALVAGVFVVCGAAQAPTRPIARFVAETANLKAGPDSIRIDIFAWSTDATRNRLVDAWNLILPPPAAAARGAATPAGRGGAGARGARGGAAPAARGVPSPATNAVRNTPETSLASALQSAEGVGYLWSSESVGYSLRYAYRLTQPGGGERIIFVTDRRLGEWDDSWKPTSGTATDYGFSIIELRLNGNNEGEGKVSLIGKVAIDSSANTIALEDYTALPVTLRNAKPRPVN